MSEDAPVSENAATIEAHDPATGERLGGVEATRPERVAEVVAAVARVQPLWALLRIEDRARYMRRMAQAVIDEFEELLEELAREQGRPRAEVAALELLAAIDALIWIADGGRRVLEGRRVRVNRSMALAKRARVVNEPYGVIGVIGAGSAPFAQPLGQIAGALLAGNGVVFKPAPRACLAGELLERVVARAGLPEGLVRVVHGGEEVGAALTRAPLQKVLFTGSPAVGRAVARECVSREREVTVELGGKDAMIVLEDADVERTVDGAVWAAFAAAGQARGSVERIYVAQELEELFLARLAARAAALPVGDPRDQATQVGPLCSERRLRRVRELVEEAVGEGARLHCGGPLEQPPAGCSGAFYRPAVLSGVDPSMRIMREPIGGPVVTVTGFDSIDRAIELAGGGDFCLGASIWTAERHRGTRIARELRAGMVWLNDHLPSPMVSRGPWGAAPGGGLGRALGRAGLEACAQAKLITWDPPALGGLWWMPYDRVAERAAQAVAHLRSSREADRERAWRGGALAMARLGARAVRRPQAPEQTADRP